MLFVPMSNPNRVAMKICPFFRTRNGKRRLDEGKDYDIQMASEIVVWLLTSNLIAPNKAGATAPVFYLREPARNSPHRKVSAVI